MDQPIQEVTTKEAQTTLQLLQEMLSNPEVLSLPVNEGPKPWMNMELTEQEIQDAVNAARKCKYYQEKDRRDMESERERIEFMKGSWTVENMLQYVKWRAHMKLGFSKNGGDDGKPVFTLDEHNATVIHALCFYFTNNPLFEKLYTKHDDGSITNHNWRLKKGLLICGCVGSGKTRLMQAFAINKRQVFDVVSARELSNLFARKSESGGYEVIEQFSVIHRPLMVKCEDNLWQEKLGLCLDDVGTEQDKANYGNKSNVIAEILDGRYANDGLAWDMTHITTNLDEEGVKEKYGPRIWSRIMERFNIIELGGLDRRERKPSEIQIPAQGEIVFINSQ